MHGVSSYGEGLCVEQMLAGNVDGSLSVRDNSMPSMRQTLTMSSFLWLVAPSVVAVR